MWATGESLNISIVLSAKTLYKGGVVALHVTVVNAVQLENAPSPIFVTPLGMVIEVSA